MGVVPVVSANVARAHRPLHQWQPASASWRPGRRRQISTPSAALFLDDLGRFGYRRTASSFQEINAGALQPLDFALPELRGTTLAGGVGQHIKKTSRKTGVPKGFEQLCS